MKSDPISNCNCNNNVLLDFKDGRRLDGVPVLLRKGIGPLLDALLALGQALVLSDSHG